MARRTLDEIYPPFGVRIHCGELTLRPLRDEDIPEVEELIGDGIADPALPMPFLVDWHLQDRSTAAADSVKFWWGTRADFSPAKWGLVFVVCREGQIVGVQDVMTTDFDSLGVMVTGSWLGRRFHGRGIGTRMRQMICAWGFDALGAREMRSGYIDGNLTSEAVSRKVGYTPNGHRWLTGDDGPRLEREVVLTPERFNRPPDPVTFEGADAFRRFIGLGD